MSEYKLFVQRIGLVGVTNILVSLSSLILLPILTKNLTIQDYSIYVQFSVTLMVIPLIINLGLPPSMIRFLAAKNEKEEIKEGFYSITFFLVFMALITSFVLLLLSKQIAEILFNGNVVISQLLAINVLIEVISSSFFFYFRTFQQMKLISILSMIQTYIAVTVIVFLVLSGYGIIGVIFGNLIVQFVVSIFAVIFIIHQIGFKFPKFENIREYLSFGIPTVPSNLSSWLVNMSDRYVIGILLGTSFVGYYSPGYTLGNIILMFAGPFGFLLPPLLTSYYDQNRIEEVKIHLQYSLKYFLLISIPSVFVLSILSKPLLTVLSTPEIAQNGYLITPFVALSAFIMGIYSIIVIILVLEKKTKIIGSMWVTAAIANVGLNIVMVPRFGIVAAAVTTLAAYTFTFAVSLFYSLKYIRFTFDMKFIFKSLTASILMSFVIIFINPTTIIEILMTFLVSSVVYLLILFFLKGISSTEIEFFKKLVQN